MAIRDWSGPVVVAIAAVWALVLTVVFWGPEVREVWRARTQSETVFVVAHPSTWVVYLVLLIVPGVVLVLVWWRGRAI